MEIDDRESILLKELNDVKAKLLQLQNTTTWWSKCAANWREKWGLMRNQRNQLRNEINKLQTKNDALLLECTNSSELNSLIKQEVEKLKILKKIARVETLCEGEGVNELQNIILKNKGQKSTLPKFQSILHRIEEERDKNNCPTENEESCKHYLKFLKIKELILSYCDQFTSVKR